MSGAERDSPALVLLVMPAVGLNNNMHYAVFYCDCLFLVHDDFFFFFLPFQIPWAFPIANTGILTS